ncbi:MAG: hypothetical protein NTW66_03070 [Candidatus Magasanikbacteria bacterium]|nr:hypothetical protein [Candidatus Magasanikbacteria bacterium]
MYAFRTRDTLEKECISLIFLVFIISASIAISVVEIITGKNDECHE